MPPTEEKEWTLMFYFASDTSLAPETVSQLKAIKQAGFHPDANVIALFDPNPENVGTHIFDINRIPKIEAPGDEKSKIGYLGFTPNDPFVTTLVTDKLWRNDGKERTIRQLVIKYVKDKLAKEMRRNKERVDGRTIATTKEDNGSDYDVDFNPPIPPPTMSSSNGSLNPKQQGQANSQSTTSDELGPKESLTNFLTFCSENYPARHYILFILGHGLVVGNDTFLFDEHAAEHSLKLQPLRETLDTFRQKIKERNAKAEFELISFHSCSMSSLEVAFELQGIANYMLASQSPSFVGSWPYRQILISIFNFLERKEKNVKELLTKIFHYCWFNSHDFLVAGYPSDVCLCDLNRVASIKKPISDLSAKLMEGLTSKNKQARELVRDSVVLAHLDAQSYFNENYNDLYDLCFRLQQRLKEAAGKKRLPPIAKQIMVKCQEVRDGLEKGVKGDDKQLIVRSDFVGAACQFSHGLSVYFPWAKPLKSEFWPNEYNQYRFVAKAPTSKKKTWSDFLQTYFDETMRQTRTEELPETEANGTKAKTKIPSTEEVLLEAFAAGVLNTNGQLGGDGNDPEKPGPDASQGAGCDCPSIKNYPRFTIRPKPERAEDISSMFGLTLTSGDEASTFFNDSSTDSASEIDEEGSRFVLDGIVD